MLDQLVEFLKRSFIKQEIDAFAGGKLAGCMLLLDALVTAALFGSLLALA